MLLSHLCKYACEWACKCNLAPICNDRKKFAGVRKHSLGFAKIRNMLQKFARKSYSHYIRKNPLFQWTPIPLRSWRPSIFSKIIPNRRRSVDSHTIWGLGASSTLPLRFFYASVTLLLRSHYDNEDLTTLSLR